MFSVTSRGGGYVTVAVSAASREYFPPIKMACERSANAKIAPGKWGASPARDYCFRGLAQLKIACLENLPSSRKITAGEHATYLSRSNHSHCCFHPIRLDQREPVETVLDSFCAQANCSDGERPVASLIFGKDGAIYGTTAGGGTHSSLNSSIGDGTVFKLTPPTAGQTAWTETVLHDFCSQANCSDGELPFASLIFEKDGALYGTTFAGGSHGGGTVFKLTPPTAGQTAWTETVLYSFCAEASCSDGERPVASLISDKDGALYGTTFEGGSHPGILLLRRWNGFQADAADRRPDRLDGDRAL